LEEMYCSLVNFQRSSMQTCRLLAHICHLCNYCTLQCSREFPTTVMLKATVSVTCTCCTRCCLSKYLAITCTKSSNKMLSTNRLLTCMLPLCHLLLTSSTCRGYCGHLWLHKITKHDCNYVR